MFLYAENQPRVEVVEKSDDNYEGVYRPKAAGPKCLDRVNWMDPAPTNYRFVYGETEMFPRLNQGLGEAQMTRKSDHEMRMILEDPNYRVPHISQEYYDSLDYYDARLLYKKYAFKFRADTEELSKSKYLLERFKVLKPRYEMYIEMLWGSLTKRPEYLLEKANKLSSWEIRNAEKNRECLRQMREKLQIPTDAEERKKPYVSVFDKLNSEEGMKELIDAGYPQDELERIRKKHGVAASLGNVLKLLKQDVQDIEKQPRKFLDTEFDVKFTPYKDLTEQELRALHSWTIGGTKPSTVNWRKQLKKKIMKMNKERKSSGISIDDKLQSPEELYKHVEKLTGIPRLASAVDAKFTEKLPEPELTKENFESSREQIESWLNSRIGAPYEERQHESNESRTKDFRPLENFQATRMSISDKLEGQNQNQESGEDSKTKDFVPLDNFAETKENIAGQLEEQMRAREEQLIEEELDRLEAENEAKLTMRDEDGSVQVKTEEAQYYDDDSDIFSRTVPVVYDGNSVVMTDGSRTPVPLESTQSRRGDGAVTELDSISEARNSPQQNTMGSGERTFGELAKELQRQDPEFREKMIVRGEPVANDLPATYKDVGVLDVGKCFELGLLGKIARSGSFLLREWDGPMDWPQFFADFRFPSQSDLKDPAYLEARFGDYAPTVAKLHDICEADERELNGFQLAAKRTHNGKDMQDVVSFHRAYERYLIDPTKKVQDEGQSEDVSRPKKRRSLLGRVFQRKKSVSKKARKSDAQFMEELESLKEEITQAQINHARTGMVEPTLAVPQEPVNEITATNEKNSITKKKSTNGRSGSGIFPRLMGSFTSKSKTASKSSAAASASALSGQLTGKQLLEAEHCFELGVLAKTARNSSIFLDGVVDMDWNVYLGQLNFLLVKDLKNESILTERFGKSKPVVEALLSLLEKKESGERLSSLEEAILKTDNGKDLADVFKFDRDYNELLKSPPAPRLAEVDDYYD